MTTTDPAPSTAAPLPAILPDCGKCDPRPPQFADLLGHDHLGHLAQHALSSAGFVYTTEIALATDTELLAVRNIGAEALERIRTRIPRAQATLERYTPTVLMARLPGAVHVEPWMLTELDRAAPLWLLTVFAHHDARVWPHVGPRWINFTAMAGQRWQPGERLVIQAARSLYGAKGRLDLAAAAVQLGELQWNALLEAMRIRRDGSRSAQ